MVIIDATCRLALQPRRIEIGYVGIARVEQVQHVHPQPRSPEPIICPEIDQSRRLRPRAVILDQRRCAEMAGAARSCETMPEVECDPPTITLSTELGMRILPGVASRNRWVNAADPSSVSHSVGRQNGVTLVPQRRVASLGSAVQPSPEKTSSDPSVR